MSQFTKSWRSAKSDSIEHQQRAMARVGMDALIPRERWGRGVETSPSSLPRYYNISAPCSAMLLGAWTCGLSSHVSGHYRRSSFRVALITRNPAVRVRIDSVGLSNFLSDRFRHQGITYCAAKDARREQQMFAIASRQPGCRRPRASEIERSNAKIRRWPRISP